MRILSLIFLVTLVLSCVRNNKIPKEVLPQNEMRKVMWDMMRADAYVSDIIMKDSTRDQKTESAILYEKIFRIHSTTHEAFKKSLSFYESRPDLFKVISDSLRSDEKNVQQNLNYIKKPQVDTTYRKMNLNKKIIKIKQ
jgi:Domain of unknown function (DUF4296)